MRRVAGTGHRPDKLGGYDLHLDHNPVARELFRRGQSLLEMFGKLGPVEVIGGCALGWDQLWVYAAYKMGIPYTLAVPFLGFDRLWPAESRRKHDWFLKHATSVVTVSPTPPKMSKSLAAELLQARNEWMVNECTDIATAWDGTPGGTSNCIAYAHQVLPDDRIHHLWDVNLDLLRSEHVKSPKLR